MGAEEAKKDTSEVATEDQAQEKSVIPLPDPVDKVSRSKTSANVEKATDNPNEKNSGATAERDAVLAAIETEKRLALIKAWEESEKSKAENSLMSRAHKMQSATGTWENSMKASAEAQLKKMEKKAEYGERMKNKIAEIHKATEEKRAMIEAKRRENLLKIEEAAAKYRASGTAPKKLHGCLGSFDF
ncbi:Remorin [Vitis vinifera]|uniref:Remorin n=1 Tax=Vitis vinifera TaxID=29760 RepID=A0A438JJH9_VITVI|nr:Remorin [Vitis vinifera]